MRWAFLVCLLLIALFLWNFRRRLLQGDREMAGLNLMGAIVCTIAGTILAQFV